jgi:hypothetical protein
MLLHYHTLCLNLWFKYIPPKRVRIALPEIKSSNLNSREHVFHMHPYIVQDQTRLFALPP